MIDILYFIVCGIHIAICVGFSLKKAQIEMDYMNEPDEDVAAVFLGRIEKIEYVQRMCWYGIVIASMGYLLLKMSH